MAKKRKTKPKTRVEYSSNNSGGSWWLKDKQWKDLEKAGWKVQWFRDEDGEFLKADKDGRWLGALASHATRYGVKSLAEAVAEWERITGACSTDAGCPCCGPPHNFTMYEGDKCVDSGPTVSYQASW